MAGRVWPTQEARQVARRPRGHVGARVGRHMSRSREEIIRQLIGESSPLFNRVLSLYLFSVRLCSHTILFCRTRGGARIVRFGWNGGDRVDPSPRDRQIKHVLQIGSKWIRSKRLPDDTWRHQVRRITIAV